MLRQGLTPILVYVSGQETSKDTIDHSFRVLNNDGYVIERKIHGENAAYNEIASWRWQEMLHFFGAKEGSTASYRVSNRKELDQLFGDADFAKADKMQ